MKYANKVILISKLDKIAPVLCVEQKYLGFYFDWHVICIRIYKKIFIAPEKDRE